MVGVPRKSQGCTNCRRRKRRCDLQKPSCQNCVSGGRICEGYARAVVFVNKTADGFLKREPFENAVEPQTRTGAAKCELNSVTSCDDRDGDTLHGLQNGLSLIQRRTSDGISFDCEAGLPLSFIPSGIVRVEIESVFLEFSVPLETRAGTSSLGEWLLHSATLGGKTEALETAMSALALTQVGRRTRDYTMVHAGKTAYCKALSALKRALEDKVLVKQDQTLAACQALKIYELREVARNGVHGLDSHTEGLKCLLLHRGPEKNTSNLRKCITREIRYSAMLNAIQSRRRSPLGHRAWRADYWTCAADIEQSLYDKGFDLAEVLEDIDSLREDLNAVEPGKTSAMRCFAALVCIEADLKHWHEYMLKSAELSFPWSDPDVAADQQQQQQTSSVPTNHNQNHIKLDRLRQPLLMLHFWALNIIRCISVAAVEPKLPIPALVLTQQPSLSFPSSSSSSSKSPSTNHVEPEYASTNNHSTTTALRLAWNILRFSEHLVLEANHNFGVRCIFPIRMALHCARDSLSRGQRGQAHEKERDQIREKKRGQVREKERDQACEEEVEEEEEREGDVGEAGRLAERCEALLEELAETKGIATARAALGCWGCWK